MNSPMTNNLIAKTTAEIQAELVEGINHYQSGLLRLDVAHTHGFDRIAITLNEVHQYKASDKHLPARQRDTYVSSVWYHAYALSISHGATIQFKVRVPNIRRDTVRRKFTETLEKLATLLGRIYHAYELYDLPKYIQAHMKPVSMNRNYN